MLRRFGQVVFLAAALFAVLCFYGAYEAWPRPNGLPEMLMILGTLAFLGGAAVRFVISG